MTWRKVSVTEVFGAPEVRGISPRQQGGIHVWTRELHQLLQEQGRAELGGLDQTDVGVLVAYQKLPA